MLSAIEPTGIPKAVATSFPLIAIFIFIASECRATSIVSGFDFHQLTALKPDSTILLACPLVLATVALIIAFGTLAEL